MLLADGNRAVLRDGWLRVRSAIGSARKPTGQTSAMMPVTGDMSVFLDRCGDGVETTLGMRSAEIHDVLVPRAPLSASAPCADGLRARLGARMRGVLEHVTESTGVRALAAASRPASFPSSPDMRSRGANSESATSI